MLIETDYGTEDGTDVCKELRRRNGTFLNREELEVQRISMSPRTPDEHKFLLKFLANIETDFFQTLIDGDGEVWVTFEIIQNKYLG